MADDPIDKSVKIQILLAEYDGVRNHIVCRTSASIEAAAIGIAALALIVPQLEEQFRTGALLLAVLSVVIAAIFGFIYTDLMVEVRHVRRLEARINELAGETLLTYETEYGISSGVRSRLRRLRAI